jgi:hypothetical protein
METIEFSLIGSEDLAIGYDTFPVTLADQSVEDFSEIDISHFLPAYSLAGLPSNARDGSIIQASDGTRGLWQYLDGLWVSLNHQTANASDFGFHPSRTAAQNATAWATMMASIPNGTKIILPPGIVSYNGTLEITRDVSVCGSNTLETTLRPMTPNAAGITITAGGWVRLQDFNMDRTVKPVVGGDGIVCGTGLNPNLSNLLFERLRVCKQYRGVVLCPSDISRINDCTFQECESHGVDAYYGTNGAVQWYISGTLSQLNLGSGFRGVNTTAASAIGPWMHACHSFGNAQTGYYFEGDASHKLNDVWLNWCQSSSEALSGITFHNTFGELSMVQDCWVELTGRLGSIPQGFDGVLSDITNTGHGMTFSGDQANGAVNVVGGLVWSCAWSGMNVETPRMHIVGVTFIDNGQAVHPAVNNRAGITIGTNSAHISSCSLIRDPGNGGQSRGVVIQGTPTDVGIDASNYFSGYLANEFVDTTLAIITGNTSVRFPLGLIVQTGRQPLTLVNETGGPTPTKHLRVENGGLEVLNAATTAALFHLTDFGHLTLAGGLSIADESAGPTPTKHWRVQNGHLEVLNAAGTVTLSQLTEDGLLSLAGGLTITDDLAGPLPRKHLRVQGGALRILNHAGTTTILLLDDAGNLTTTGALSLASTMGLSNFIEFGEIADPSAPVVNKGRLYVKDNGSGKSQLAVRFPSGAVQILATEP